MEVNFRIEAELSNPTTITICDTCKRQGWNEKNQVETDGETFASLIEKAARAVPGLRTRRHSCLMGCDWGCNLSITAKDKLTYVLGNFKPETEAAAAVVEYARLHAESQTGQVPFRSWPQAVKGHFTARLPVPQDDDK